MTEIITEIINDFEVKYFNQDFWQYPVKTEKQIFDNLITLRNVPHNYIAFPWASYIDNKWNKKYNCLENAINNNAKNLIDKNKTYFTVCQHIEFRDYIGVFKDLNIKYIFTPHKKISDKVIEEKNNIFIIPISLYAVQNNENDNFIRNSIKKYTASFVGQISHKNNISNVRSDIKKYLTNEKYFIKINNEWFYQKNVYSNKNNSSESVYDTDYKNIIMESKYSLCPSGTGPNSIRMWEALSFGSIPILLSDELVLPSLPHVNYDEFLLIWKENEIYKLDNYLKNLDDKKIKKMSKKCISIYNKYFSPLKMHVAILHYFENLDENENSSNSLITLNKKVILITQYYLINTSDLNYNVERQREINYCLQKNVDNKYIDEIHLFLEDEYDLSFIKNLDKSKVIKIVTGKRINFKDVFNYSNDNLKNNICILINSDIYLDESIDILKNVNFDIDKLFIALNRYENNVDNLPPLLNGLEINESEYKSCQAFLKPYQESIWSQDTWIWKSPINSVNDDYDFNLGVVGCDNYLSFLIKNNDYKIVNCSKMICSNHYDRLSIVKNEFGLSKGNISKKTESNRIGEINNYLFLENQDDIPDKYTTKIDILFLKEKPKISKMLCEKNVSSVKLNESQIVASSHFDEFHKPNNILFGNNNYWQPDNSDNNPFIKFNFENIYDIAYIDIMGSPITSNTMVFGYVSLFIVEYYFENTLIKKITYDGIKINNANYVKRIYLDETIKCNKIMVYPLEFTNIMAMKVNFYKLDFPKINLFDYLSYKCDEFEKFKLTLFDYSMINNTFSNKLISVNSISSEYKINLSGQFIGEGICIFTYVMNRNNNIYNNIKSWLNQSVNQIIILDWNSKEDLNDFIKSLNDERLLYIRVINETSFIRTYAQNLAARFCKFDKILKLDSDIVLSENFFENHKLVNGDFYVGEWRCGRDKNEEYLHGSVYLFLKDYFRINGYNEYIKNYGWDDSDFTIRLMTLGLNKRLFNLNYMYHTPHTEELRTVNLNDNLNNSLLMTYVNKSCTKNIVWNNNYKLQQFNIYVINKDFIICDRIKNNEYHFDEEIRKIAIEENTCLLKKWKIM
jgi:hypothetical protein